LNIFIQALKNNLSEELEYAVSEEEFKNICESVTIILKKADKSKTNLICDAIVKAMTEL